MDTLPPEILHNILAPGNHTTKESYLKLRLVCSTFRDIITPHVFANLCITDDECTLGRLSAIAERKDLCRLVRSYTFHFKEPHCIGGFPPFSPVLPIGRRADRQLVSTKKDYLKLISLERDLYAEALQSHTPACRSQISFLTKIRTFQLSGELESVHVNLLSSSLPNLTSLAITVDPSFSSMPPNMNSSMQSTSSPSWGPLVIRAFLLGIAGRAEPSTGLRPIENIWIDGLSEDCVYLFPDLVEKITAGMRALRDISFSLTVVQSVYDKTTPTWLYPVGRFLQASEELRSLSLRSSHFPSLSALVHFRAIIAPAVKSPAVHHWKHLSKLYLKHASIPRDLFKQFLTLHRRTLTDVTLHNCDTQYTCKQGLPMENEPCSEPWPQIFRHMYKTNGSILTNVSLRFLSSGITPHDYHLPQSFVNKWQSYLSHNTEAEPGIEDGYYSEDNWCLECSHGSYDSMDDGEDDDDSSSVFGFGYHGWGWEDYDGGDLDDDDSLDGF